MVPVVYCAAWQLYDDSGARTYILCIRKGNPGSNTCEFSLYDAFMPAGVAVLRKAVKSVFHFTMRLSLAGVVVLRKIVKWN